MNKIKIEKEKFGIYGECYKLTNGVVEVFVTKDIGPRIICYRFVDRENILCELNPEDLTVKFEGGEWHLWGGHRLWHAPEAMPRSYWPDNAPVKAEVVDANSVRVIESVESGPKIQKEMLVKLESEGAKVTITHKLTNDNMWPVELAPWVLTVMNGGGMSICPNEPFISHAEKLLPARPMVLWNFTDLSDSRLRLGRKYICLSTDSSKDFPQKYGVADMQGWAGYLRKNTLFVKRFLYIEGETYPDMGCNFESFTKGNLIEVETLGPMVKLNPGESTTHVETWHLFSGVDAGDTDDSLDLTILPLVKQTD